MTNYLVAKRDLLEAIQDAGGPGVDITDSSAKRACARQLISGGELAGDVVGIAKGA